MAMPLLRFKQDNGSNYPDWNNKKLIKLASIHARIGWQNMRVSEFQDIGDYYVITGTDFKNGKVNFDTCKFVSKERYDQDEHIQVNNGSVLVTKDGTLGKTAYIQELNKPATLNAGVYNIRSLDNHELINKYLFHYLSSPLLKKFAYEKSTNGPIRHLNQEILVNFNVKFPCPEEQQKIADFLSDIDNQIEHYQQLLDNLESQKRELLRQVFSQELRFKRDDGSDYSDWEEDVLGKYCDITTGKLNANAMNENGKYDFYTSGIKKYKIDNYAFEGPAITIAGNGATVGYLHIADGKFNAYQRTYVLTNFKCIRRYLYYIIGQELPKKIRKEVRPGVIPYIVLDMLTNLKIFLPCPEEQQKIADFFFDIENRIELERQRMQTMQELKKGLLQQMFC